MADNARNLLRHALATLAYRAGKTLDGAPIEFHTFKIGESTRTPLEILSHINDILEWSLHLAHGNHVWDNKAVMSWDAEEKRFTECLERFDEYLASYEPLIGSPETLFQGPIADAFTHVGQLNMLRRLSGSPVRGENYARANINAGAVGRDRPPAVAEFD